MSRPRRSGILLPLFALPSRYGIGDMGPEALRFADFLVDAAQTVWQVLPLTAIDGGCGNSPYSPTSAFAGNPLLISPEMLADSGLIDEADLTDVPAFDDARVDYDRVRAFKDALLRRAWTNFKRAGARSEYERFFADNRHWLEGYSFFVAIKGCRGGQPWYEWPEGLKFRRHEALHRTWLEMADEIEFHRFVQFLFSSQMGALRSRLSDLGICLSETSPSTSPGTAPTSGCTLICSSWTRSWPPSPWRGCRRTTSARRGSSGGTPSTTGTPCWRRTSVGGWSAFDIF